MPGRKNDRREGSMSSLVKAIRFVWHGLFYALTWKAGMRFALRCRKVVETIDLNEKLNSIEIDQLNFKLLEKYSRKKS